jgi:tRNA threonylcarbamoyladenosine biosynthesis protein TsaE
MTASLLCCELVGEAAQLAFGARLAQALGRRPAVIALRGELGAGKTTLVRGLLRALGHTGAVRSPTYTLLEPYERVDPPVVHLDLYRLSDPEELEYLGLRDLLDRPGWMLIEWPERAAGALPPPDLVIEIEHAGHARRLRISADPLWAPVVASLASAECEAGA